VFYVILVLPHLLAIVGLAAFAFYSGVDGLGEDGDGGSDGIEGGQPPGGPEPEPLLSGPPLIDATPPRRRMRVGERLSELYPSRRRRDHDPKQPTPRRLRT
jgi:hypothetical protein